MSWSDYMKNYGYREYPCVAHERPFCEECYGPDPLSVSKPETTFKTLMSGLDDVEEHLKNEARDK